jgi:hypothetical protein
MNKKIYPTGIIKTEDGKIDVFLTLQNEINWMKVMGSRLRKPGPVDKITMKSELWTHTMSLMRVLKHLKETKLH